MIKKLAFLLTTLSFAVGQCFEKLPSAYQICYGNPDAPITVVEYFSFTCSKCLKQIKGDFEQIKEKHIDKGQVYWVFHPDPADRLTLQAMVCLERLDKVQKRLFFEVISKNLDGKSMEAGCAMMQAAMEHFHQPQAQLDQMTFLEGTESFQHAFAFLSQEDVITTVPTVEINSRLYDEFPTRKFLEKHFELLSPKGSNPCK